MYEQPTDSVPAPERTPGAADEPSPASDAGSAPSSAEVAPDAGSEAAPPAAPPAGTPPGSDDAPEAQEAAERKEFAEALDRSLKSEAGREAKETKVGDRVRGRIVSLSDESAFVDFGGRAEGALPLSQIRDAEGNLKHKEGDTVEATVTSVEGQLALALAVKRVDAGLQALIQAKEAGTPVEGRVKGTNSGGFEVVLGGVRGFCPFSQMDVGPVGDGQQFIGQVHHFKVLDVSEKGRRVVLSRKALLRGERAKQAEELRSSLAPGAEMEGSVTRLLPFGAFVDIGGVQGLVHVSEISHRRVGDPSEALEIGQKVRVRVLKLENLGEGKKERISLSIKAAEPSPWDALETRLREGDVVRGPVLRVMDFGAFVEIFPGVDGLVHVSQLARRRVEHPKDVVAVGQEVEAKVTRIDAAARRISLSMSALEPPSAGGFDPMEMGEPESGGREGGRGGRGRGGRGGREGGREGSREGGRGGRGGGRGGEGRWESRRQRDDSPPSDSVFAEAFRRARERMSGDAEEE